MHGMYHMMTKLMPILFLLKDKCFMRNDSLIFLILHKNRHLEMLVQD